MSRSFKKNYIHGFCGDSDKFDKRLARKRLRRINKILLLTDDLESVIFKLKRETSSVWCFTKDGKFYFGNKPDWLYLKRK